MKIVVLESSPNKHGSSNLLADSFIRGAEEAGHTCTVIDAASAKLHRCTGCIRCGYDGPCVQKDDMEGIRREILSADMLVFVMPVYYYNWPTSMKVVVDRFYSYTGTLTSMRKKTALIGAAWDDTDTVFEVVTAYYRKLCDYMDFRDQGIIEGRGCGSAGICRRPMSWAVPCDETGNSKNKASA